MLKALSGDTHADHAVLTASRKTMSDMPFDKILTKGGVLRTAIGDAHKGWTLPEPENLRALLKGRDETRVMQFSRRTLGTPLVVCVCVLFLSSLSQLITPKNHKL